MLNSPLVGEFIDQCLKNDQVPDLQQLLKDDLSATVHTEVPGLMIIVYYNIDRNSKQSNVLTIIIKE